MARGPRRGRWERAVGGGGAVVRMRGRPARRLRRHRARRAAGFGGLRAGGPGWVCTRPRRSLGVADSCLHPGPPRPVRTSTLRALHPPPPPPQGTARVRVWFGCHALAYVTCVDGHL
ncbi:uncharacterized protein LOC121824099 [Peromyscus maniculatus bairdii]|uniref:uncharacterized protein LOC121824099 n=1 Tax=Peromyscus maniculatus bairdii TaxID=230844 RepID=UPI003FD0DC9B